LKRDHSQWVELLSVCGHCADRGACGLVLDKGDLSRPADTGFCPNAASFAAMAPRAA
jgi:hypothetical protein